MTRARAFVVALAFITLLCSRVAHRAASPAAPAAGASLHAFGAHRVLSPPGTRAAAPVAAESARAVPSAAARPAAARAPVAAAAAPAEVMPALAESGGAWEAGERAAWGALLASGVASYDAAPGALCLGGDGGKFCVAPFLQIRSPWSAWLAPCDPVKGWRFQSLMRSGFDAHPAVSLAPGVDGADALVWIPTCTPPSFSIGDAVSGADLARLAVLDESDGVGHWPQVNGRRVGVYFKRSWVHKRNGTHVDDGGAPLDVIAKKPSGAICEGDGAHCAHHGSRAWKNRDRPRDGRYFAPLPYATWDNYTKGLRLFANRDVRVVCTVRVHAEKQPARTRVVNWLRDFLYGELGLSDGDDALVGDTGGHRKMIDSSYFDWMRRAQIIVTCNPSHWDGDFRLFEALASGVRPPPPRRRRPENSPSP